MDLAFLYMSVFDIAAEGLDIFSLLIGTYLERAVMYQRSAIRIMYYIYIIPFLRTSGFLYAGYAESSSVNPLVNFVLQLYVPSIAYWCLIL